MTILPIHRYTFRLTGEEINALDLISNIDCSDANNCEGCPLRIKVADETYCLKHFTSLVLRKTEGFKDE